MFNNKLKEFDNFNWYYSILKSKIFISFIISILIGFLDGLGLTMFLPLLQMIESENSVNPESMGNLGFILDIFQNTQIPISLVSILILMVFFFVLKGLFKYLNEWYKVYLQQIFISSVRKNLINQISNVNYKHYVSIDSGRSQNILTSEVERVQLSYMYFFQTFEQFTLVIVYMGFAFFIDFKFAILVTIGGFLTNLLYKSIYQKTKLLSSEFAHESDNYQGKVLQFISNFKYLKSTAVYIKYKSLIEKSITQIENSRKKIGILSGILVAAREPILIVVISVVMIVQVKLLNGGLGPILISLLFFYRALNYLTTLQNSWNRYLGVYGSTINVKNYLNELSNNKSIPSKFFPFNGFNDSIKFENVSFAYLSKKNIDNISLSIKKNESIALIGKSGSGKSTLVNLICGLLKAESGKILIDNISIDKIDLESYKSNIGYITQEPVVFNDTLFNNITLWEPKTNENISHFNKVIEKVDLSEFVADLQKKENTFLGQNGINISGGQKQRISIARELFKKKQLLIMDEATSALDNLTEKQIQKTIEGLKGKITIIVIAHRISTIKNMDRIYIMKNGSVYKKGTYASLSSDYPQFF